MIGDTKKKWKKYRFVIFNFSIMNLHGIFFNILHKRKNYERSVFSVFTELSRHRLDYL